MNFAKRLAFAGIVPLLAALAGCHDDSDSSGTGATEARGVRQAGGGGSVQAVEVDGVGNVWLGGSFSEAFNGDEPQGSSGIQVRNLARFNVAAGTFDNLGVTGMDGPIFALAYDAANNDMYLGGQFTQVNGVPANRIARVDVDTMAVTVVSDGVQAGFNGDVHCLLVAGGFLYAGGAFTTFDTGNNASRVARIDIPIFANWQPMVDAGGGEGTDNTVRSLALDPTDGTVLVGGAFTNVRVGMPAAANRIARWNPVGPAWSVLGPGAGGFPNGEVLGIAVHDDLAGTETIYAGGSFIDDGSGTPQLLASFQAGVWTEIGGMTNGVVQALAIGNSPAAGLGELLYIGGFFLTFDGNPAGNLALVDDLGQGAPQTPGPLTVDGTDGGVLAIRVDPNDATRAPIGGDFDLADETPVKNVATATSNGTNLGRLQ